MPEVLTQSPGILELQESKSEPPKPELVLALDPGVTTGFCFGAFDKDKLYLAPGEKAFSLSEFDELLWWLGALAHLHIVYEDFEYRNYARMGLDLTPVKFQGIIELYAERWKPFVTFDKQNASVQGEKTFYSNDELKRLGVYWPHGRGHARSATKHLLYWATFGAGALFIDMQLTEPEPVELDWLLDTYYDGMRIR